MKKILVILSLTLVFACHTKKEQNKSGMNDATNMMYSDVDSTVVDMPKKQAVVEETPKVDTAAAVNSCIDSTKINKEAMCIQQYKPVCGCDGKTYSNQCMADKAGVTSTTPGKCK